MPWTYRVVHRVYRVLPGTGTSEDWAIYEAYDEGNVNKPKSLSAKPIWPAGESVEALKADLAKMRRALELPVLEYEDFREANEK